MNSRTITILGGGAVGSVLAAALSTKSGVDLKLIGRANHIAIINNEGLCLSGKVTGNFKMCARQAVDYSLKNSLLIVTVKAVDLSDSLVAVKKYIDHSTSLLLLQNGYGIKEQALKALTEVIDPQKIYVGISGIAATFSTAGNVSFFGGNLRLEESFQASLFSDIFADTFIAYDISPCIEKDIWRKLIINSIVNPLSLLLRVKNNIVADERFDYLKNALLEEGLAVAAAEGINLHLDVSTINKFISSENISSMLQDYLKKKHSEIDFINGAMCSVGSKHGIATPVNCMITHLVKAIEIVRSEDNVVLDNND